MTVHDDLVAARALIDTPEKLIKGRWANEQETCFCTWGAVIKVSSKYDHRSIYLLAEAVPDFVSSTSGAGRVISYNDHPDTTHADIMALFDRAIAASEVQP